MAGAPGSKWSSVVKNIYYSEKIDRSDNSPKRSYAYSDAYNGAPMHLGSYFDPGMEFGTWFDRLDRYSPAECEQEFDRPFTGTGVRIIKSHVFCHHIDFLRTHWPDCPVVTVYRPTDACFGWWVRCGHFDITYPDYRQYYKNFECMYQHIQEQNRDLTSTLNKTPACTVWNNLDLCGLLNISAPPTEYFQDYVQSEIDVKVYQGSC